MTNLLWIVQTAIHNDIYNQNVACMLTCVPNDVIPAVVSKNVYQERSYEGSERPQSYCGVSGAGGHGEGTIWVAGKTWRFEMK